MRRHRSQLTLRPGSRVSRAWSSATCIITATCSPTARTICADCSIRSIWPLLGQRRKSPSKEKTPPKQGFHVIGRRDSNSGPVRPPDSFTALATGPVEWRKVASLQALRTVSGVRRRPRSTALFPIVWALIGRREIAAGLGPSLERSDIRDGLHEHPGCELSGTERTAPDGSRAATSAIVADELADQLEHRAPWPTT